MHRQAWVGLFLITLLMFLWTFWLSYTYAPSERLSSEPKAVDTTARTGVSSSPPAPSRQAVFGPYTPFTEGRDSIVIVETAVARYIFGTRGARLVQHQLKDYTTSAGKPVQLWDSTQKSAFIFAEGRNIIPSDSLYFQLVHAPRSPIREGSDSVVFRLSFSPDTFIQVTYLLQGLRYELKWRVWFRGLRARLRNPYLIHSVAYATPQTEPSAKQMWPHCALYYLQAEDVESLTPEEDEKVQRSLHGKIHWVAAKGQFFCAIFHGEEPFVAAEIQSLPTPALPVYHLNLMVPFQGEKVGEVWYLGPTRYGLLRSYGAQYEAQLSLGWAFIRYINTLFIIPVFAFLERYIANYGLIILILALLVKIILSPITWRTYLIGAKMQVAYELPEVKALEEKYKDQPDKLMIERTLLLRQLGINPLSGCVPALLQMPIFFAMVSFFPNAFELRQKKFLWASDLSSYDDLIRWGFNLPLLGDHLSLFALLMTLSLVAYTYFTQQSQPAAANPALKWLPYITPIVFFFFLNSSSAALSWYYTVLNGLTIVQVIFMKRLVNKEEIVRRLRAYQQKQQRRTLGAERARLRRWLGR
ncbi:MAG: YidC/Oxa1 family insertase periplasmic-domain containing protein [Bacteroidia bacterium]